MLIGIGGVSRAGKSTLAKLLAAEFVKINKSVAIIHQDEHVVAESQLQLIRDKLDWEHPSSIDWFGLNQVIQERPKDHDIVILEGLFAFNNNSVNELITYKVFVEISKRIFLKRKQKDVRWGGTPEQAWYMEHIWDSYLTYGRPKLDQSFLCINGARRFDIDRIVKTLSSDF